MDSKIFHFYNTIIHNESIKLFGMASCLLQPGHNEYHQLSISFLLAVFLPK